jgi:hypothetical protein
VSRRGKKKGRMVHQKQGIIEKKGQLNIERIRRIGSINGHEAREKRSYKNRPEYVVDHAVWHYGATRQEAS